MQSLPENAAPTVFVVGGTGFIGYHVVQQLLAQGMRVRVLTRNINRTQHQALFPASVDYREGDLAHLTTEQLRDMMQGCSGLVFAAGSDERVEPDGDAREFFRRANVASAEKVFRAAQGTSITHAALLSSVFLKVHHEQPELKLAERHPYIASRVEQHEISAALATDHFVLTTLEIPWVFGTAPHIASQWNSLITYVRSATPLLCCRGGVNVVAVQSVAEAAVAALSYPTQSSRQAIGDLNLGYQQLVERLCVAAQRKDRTIRLVNDDVFLRLMQAGGLFRKLFNIPAGLDITYLPELLMRDIYIDNASSQQLLRYRAERAAQAITDTVQAAPENRYLKGWRSLLNLLQR